ncbi:MAG: hypothetical protein D6765_02935 [Bacteroidetes bacterium]|nr:MAG: hypothetical protein D6765_02935 [Bacteroidota bacterium]
MKSSTLLSVLLLAAAPLFSQNALTGTWLQQGLDAEGNPNRTVLQILPDGSFQLDLNQDGTFDIQGRYEIDGNQVTIWHVGPDATCPAEQKGLYRYSLDGEYLSMTRISDPCPERGGPRGMMGFKRM